MNILYLIGSFAGIALLVGLNVLLLGRARPGLGSAVTIAERLSCEIPGFRAGACACAVDRGAALVENQAGGGLLLACALGDGFVARKLSHEVLRGVRREGSRLSLRLADFTIPRADLSFADEAVAREWETRLKAHL